MRPDQINRLIGDAGFTYDELERIRVYVVETMHAVSDEED